MSPVAGAVGGAAGLLLGILTATVLRRGGYRVDGEKARPRPTAATVGVAGGALGVAGVVEGLMRPFDTTLVLVAVFGVLALAAAWIDLDVRRVPNMLTGGGTLAVLVVSAAIGPWSSALRALSAGGVLLAAFAMLALVSSVGSGDVKFAAVIGVALGFEGWATVLSGVMAGMLLAAGVAAVLLARGRARDSHLALAAPLAAGALIVLLLP